MILNILQERGEFKTLTSVARVDRNMYDIAIPKIYQTVTVNERNRDKIGYGHGTSTSDLELGMCLASISQTTSGKSKLTIATSKERMTRKDLATTFTRKLVFNFEPKTAIPKSYRAVEEVIFGPACMYIARHLHGTQIQKSDQANRVASLFANCLTAVASTGNSAAALHAKMHMVYRIDYHMLRDQLTRLKTAIPIAYEFFNVPIGWRPSALGLAFAMRALVHFEIDVDTSREEMAQELADQISEILADGDSSESTSEVYLCEVPQLVLRPDELNLADDTNEAAMVKICSLIPDECWPNQVTPTKRLEFLKSKVKLVGAGFRPTLPQVTTQDST